MAYSDFARFYDLLTENVDYKSIAGLYTDILRRRGINQNRGKVLDLACGSGSLSLFLQKAGFEVIGADLSEEMLTAAAAKSSLIRWIKADMTTLPFQNEFDGAICALDSLNHLPDLNAIFSALKGVYSSLKKGGVFAADINTPYKHREILGNNAFNFDYEGLFCAWQNELSENDPLNKVEMFLDFFEEQEDGSYLRYQDSLCEIAPKISQITEIMESCGFNNISAVNYPDGGEIGECSEKVIIAGSK